MNKRLFWSLQFIFLVIFKAFSFDLEPMEEIKFYPTPIMDLRSPVTRLGWNIDDTFFAVTAKESWYMEPETKFIEEIVSPEGKIVSAEFAWNTKDGAKEIQTLTDSNVLTIRRFPLSDQYIKRKYNAKRVRCSAFSRTGDNAALGMDNGEVHLAQQLYLTQTAYSEILRGHTGQVYSVTFSSDSDLLASAATDGMIFIWDVRTRQMLHALYGSKKSKLPICFTPDTNLIAHAESPTKVVFRTIDGVTESEINISKPMKTFSISEDGKVLYALYKNSHIGLYDIESGREIGYVPYFSNSPVTSFKFNREGDKVLVGHKDGFVFLLEIEQVLLFPGAKQPRLAHGTFSTPAGSSAGEGNSVDSSIGRHNIDIRLDISKPDDPFMVTLAPTVGYLNGGLISPFYFGGFVKGSISIPEPSFPYAYVDLNTGRTVHNPYILGLGATAPFGVFFKPFTQDVAFFVEIQPGVMFYTMHFPNYGSKDLYPSFSVELQAGMCWKQLLVFAGGLYDYRLGPSVSAGVGWRIKVGKK